VGCALCRVGARSNNVVEDNRKSMINDLSQLINRWVFDLEAKLWDRLDSLKDDLRSDDDHVRQDAMEQADEIFSWLYPPAPPMSNAGQLERIQSAAQDPTLTTEEKIAAVKKAGRSTGRPPGRPRTETAQQAIRALTLHYGTNMSWREIALELKGCNHQRPNPERSCDPCGDAIRDAAGRFEKFLIRIGFDMDLPQGEDSDGSLRRSVLAYKEASE
jgi:hypothetical protein